MVSSKRPDERRILALWLPRLSTDRIRRRKDCAVRPEAPLVIVAKTNNALRLSAIDANAARLSLKVGMPLADARAMVPELSVIEADASADTKLLESIADWCDRFTPFVALDPPDGLLLDVTGATHLFGGEKAMLAHVRALFRRQNFAVQASLAGTAMAARALARHADGAIVDRHGESEAVAPLPVAALGLDPAITHAFRRAGLKTIGQVAGRGRTELASRFGRTMVDQLDRALGRSEAPISPRRRLPDFMAEHRFAEPVVTEEIISASLLALAQSLSQILELRGQGARKLQAIFFRADGSVRSIAIETARPTRDAKIVLRLFCERLDALADPLDPGFGFDLIRLEAVHAEREEQTAQGFADDDSEKEIAFLIDRLAARFGTTRILTFHPQDTHIPEAASVALPAQYAKTTKQAWVPMNGEGEPPRRPFRLFANPEPIEVMAEVPDGPPQKFRWRRALHGVVRAEGPERIAMEWWRSADAKPTRDYFRVEDEAGHRFWLYRDGLYAREVERPRWFIHGLFA
jgi:protein ImuB